MVPICTYLLRRLVVLVLLGINNKGGCRSKCCVYVWQMKELMDGANQDWAEHG